MINKVLKRLGLKDEFGYDDPTIFGFVIIWSLIGYGAYVTVVEIFKKFLG